MKKISIEVYKRIVSESISVRGHAGIFLLCCARIKWIGYTESSPHEILRRSFRNDINVGEVIKGASKEGAPVRTGALSWVYFNPLTPKDVKT